MLLCDALVKALYQFGVRQMFGVGGANIEHVFDAAYRLQLESGAGIEPVLCKSEVGAAFMADGLARLGNGLGLCCATSGGGMMNLAVGVAESRASAIPVIALVGLPPQPGWGRGAFQDSSGGDNGVDAEGLWRSICKYSAVVTAENFWASLHTAITQAINGSPGPCALLLPRNIMTIDVGDPPGDWPRSLDELREPVPLLPAMCDHILQIMSDAQHPVIVAGEGVDQCEALAQFAALQNIPVVTTLAATAAIAQTHSQFAGIIGVAGHRNAHALMQDADLVLVFGCQLEGMVRAPIEAALSKATIIVVHHRTDSVPPEWNAQCFVAAPRLALAQLTASTMVVYADRPLDNWTRCDMDVVKPVCIKRDTGRRGMALSRALSVLQHQLQGFDQIFFDAGNCAASAAHYLELPEGARSRIALGMGGMGYAICASIGARMGAGSGQSLVVCGDGAFLMTGLEIHTAIERQLPILWLVCNDSQHGMCTTRQRYFFEHRLVANRYAEVDVWQIAAGLSAENALWTGCAHNENELEIMLRNYLQKGGPGVLEIKIGVEEVPPFFPLMSLGQRELAAKSVLS